MAELHNVYDLLYPIPPPLQDIASIQVALGVWRQEITKQRINNTLNDFYWTSNPSLSTLIPNAPPGIWPIIEKYVKRIGKSMVEWLEYLISRDIFKFKILNCFDDFVCDLNGDIHGERTAKRMIVCDEICDKVKFKLACQYCFEDEIYKFWPLVSSDVNLDGIFFHLNAPLFYWICYLENKMDRIPMDFEEYQVSTAEERLVSELIIEDGNWPAIRYFWNRLDSDAQWRCLFENHGSLHSDTFFRYILAKLNKNELQKLLNGHLHDLSVSLLYTCIGVYFNIEMWTYIKDKLDKDQFISFVRYLMEEYVECTEKALCLLEIWTSAPKKLKMAAFPEILHGKPVYEISSFSDSRSMRNKNVYLLSAVVKDAPIEDRKTFWKENLRDLCTGFGPKEFQHFVKVNGMKLKLVCEFEHIRQPISVLLNEARFEDLGEFLTLFCENEQTIRDMKLKGLSVVFTISPYHIVKPFLLNRFIEDAYNDVNLANEFKTKLLESSQTMTQLKYYMEVGLLQRVIEFVDTLAPSEEIAEQVKNRDIFPTFLSTLRDESNRRGCTDNMANFMRWCLGSDEGIERFKQSFNVDDLMLHLMAEEMAPRWYEVQYCTRYCNLRRKRVWNSLLLAFLQWYFVTEEDFEKFKTKYSGDFVFSEARMRVNVLYLFPECNY